jgi:3-carboxy-cis,cis-muconate cycloisomerase
MPTTLDDTLLRDLYGTPAMRAVFDSRRLVQGWLDAEAALALALADTGVIPADAAAAVARAC